MALDQEHVGCVLPIAIRDKPAHNRRGFHMVRIASVEQCQMRRRIGEHSTFTNRPRNRHSVVRDRFAMRSA